MRAALLLSLLAVGCDTRPHVWSPPVSEDDRRQCALAVARSGTNYPESAFSTCLTQLGYQLEPAR
jgi:hypothetical protein